MNAIIVKCVEMWGSSSFGVDEAGDGTDAVIYTPEFIHSFTHAGMATHEVVLKVSAPYILLRTINPASAFSRGPVSNYRMPHRGSGESAYPQGLARTLSPSSHV